MAMLLVQRLLPKICLYGCIHLFRIWREALRIHRKAVRIIAISARADLPFSRVLMNYYEILRFNRRHEKRGLMHKEKLKN